MSIQKKTLLNKKTLPRPVLQKQIHKDQAPPHRAKEESLTKNSELSKERIAKAIARSGVCSRREAEKLIAEGAVYVNGECLTTPAFLVSEKDHIVVSGRLLESKEKTRLWKYYKPKGTLVTNYDPQGRPTIFEQIPQDLPRVISIGRLDYNSEGLLLLTNDGALARWLELPQTGWIRRYRVRAFGNLTPEKIESLAKGVTIDGYQYGPIDVSFEKSEKQNIWVLVSLREGKNREIRKVFEHIGLQVSRLIRVSFGPFELGSLKKRCLAEISPKIIREQIGTKFLNTK